MLELSSAMPMRIVGLDEATVEKIVSTHKGYSPITLKAGTYDWQTEDIMTVNGPVMLVTNANVPDDLVYNMAKALFEAHGTLVDVHQVMNEFTPENAAANPAVPIHPGALPCHCQPALPSVHTGSDTPASCSTSSRRSSDPQSRAESGRSGSG